MKKSILALLGALICTLGISYGVHATSYNLAESCPEGELVVAQGENAEIILNGNTTCRIINNGTAAIKGSGTIDSGKSVPTITNNGTLTIASGNINKAAKHDSIAPIVNNGTLVISGGSILADHGIQHNRGTLTMNGGKIRAWLHPAIWVNNSASVRINGGTLQFPSDWVGIHTTGNVAICGGTFIGGSRTNLTEAEETKTCPATDSSLTTPEKTPEKPIANLVKVENDTKIKAAKAEQRQTETPVVITTAKVAKNTTPIIVTAQPRTTDHVVSQNTPKAGAPKAETSKPEEKPAETTDNKEEQSTDLSVTIAAILFVIVAASTGIIVTRNK